ncbi:MAG: ferrous iron transport protein A [Thermodesulfovibrionales bacterium]|nr:ferrous iron transport protein A [Thermodesulfovibrionales bacterium]
MFPLSFLLQGERAEIVEIRGHRAEGKGQLKQAEDRGLRKGKVIEILNNIGTGPLLLKVDNICIAISRDLAMKIMVRRLD